MKKTIALFCALLLAFSLFVPFAWAEEGKKEEQKDVLVLDSLTWLAHNIQVSYPRGEIRICPAVLEKEDAADIIPRFSLAALLSPADYNGAVRKDCGNKDLDTAHNRSYYA